jgi:hypothetical protein
MTTTLIRGLALARAGAARAANADTLYKLIDKNGKVTYSEEKPKQFDGQVIRLDIDPNATTVTLPKAAPPGSAAADARKPNPAVGRLEAAQDRLERAKAALQDARDHPRDDELARVGNVGGFTRPVPSEAYLQRLSRLEEEVRNAEQAVTQLEKGR